MKGKRTQVGSHGLPNPAQVVVDIKLASQCTACTPGNNTLDLFMADDRDTRVPLVKIKKNTITIYLCGCEKKDSKMVLLYHGANTAGIDTVDSNADSLHI